MISKILALSQTIATNKTVPWALIVLFALLCVSSTFHYIQTAISDRLTQMPAAESQQRSPQGVPPLSSIANAHLFGLYTAPISKKPSKTTLTLYLLGTLTSPDSKSGSAIIAQQKDGDGKLYLVGESLPGDAVIEEVFADHIVIRRQGKQEILTLPQYQGTTNTLPPSSTLH